MKKILTILSLSVCVTALTSYGQGAFNFGGNSGYVWNDFGGSGAPGAIRASNNVDVSFLLGTGTALISSLQASMPTNSYGQNLAANTQGFWSALLNDPNYQIATNNGTAGTAGMVLGMTSTVGGYGYPGSGGGTFFINGTSASGGSINIIVFGWDATYSTPQAAAAAGAAVGWTAPYAYNYGATTGTPTTTGAQGLTGGVGKFGVWAPVPEPTSFALAGLGAAAMLIFRRRK